ncbi:MAG: LLM class flavin-dependent oxidoreductase [Candidatus Rokubacteria bacterium]|nr:LLM class flavin-dependent oxidoreductase [Candidatus Rokubacteria bacterium]
MTRWAREAERAGLGSLWFVEDYFEPGAFSLAAAAAAVTESPAIGLGVVNPFTRHPALLAMETAALSGVASGRVLLGLGSSNRVWIEEQMGIPFTTPLQALRECVEIIRRLWSGERLSYQGRCFTLRDVALDFKPAQPELPILLGAKAPKALTLAGEVADGVHCSILASPEHVRRVCAITAEARRSAGRAGDFAVIAYLPMAVAQDGERARAHMKPLLARYLGLLHGQSILKDAGLSDARTLPFKEALLRGESPTHLVSDDLLETFAVAGTPDECRRALSRWAEAGLDAPVAVPAPGLDPVEQLQFLGSELAPFWREMVCR